jgi:hypothetical protein
LTAVRIAAIAAAVLFALGFVAAFALRDGALYSAAGTTVTGPPPTTEPTGVPSPSPPPPSLSEDIDRQLKALPLARVAFNAPTELQKGESAEIQLLLAFRKSIAVLQDELTEVGERHGATVRVSDVMEATLTGQGFKIEAVTPEQQVTSRDENTEWRWDIEPTKTGTQRLHLTLSALIYGKGTATPHAVRVLERPIVVRVTWRDKLTGFVGGNWQWIWAAILVPAAAFGYRAWRGRRGTQAKPPKSEES